MKFEDEQKKLAKVKSQLVPFLKNKFKGVVKPALKLFDGFVPDFTVSTNKKKRAIIFRHPPSFPEHLQTELNIATTHGTGVYIAVYDNEYEEFFDELLTIALRQGIGVLHYSIADNEWHVQQPALCDYPAPDKIVEDLNKIFISSMLFTPEREIARKKIQERGNQPIQVERTAARKNLDDTCFDLIDKSEYFVGIVTSKYRPMVDSEIRYALSKKPDNCLIYVRSDSHSSRKKKLHSLIARIKEKKQFHPYDTEKTLGKLLWNHLPKLTTKKP